MSDLAYGVFSLLDGRFIIEDVAYDSCPDSWSWQGNDEAVRGDTVRTLTHTRKNTIQPARTGRGWNTYATSALTGSATNYYTDARYIIRQMWSVGWSSAFMSWCMRDHLMTLYSLQKGFWLRYDDEMSREGVTLQAVNTARTQFVTPTYPIAMYRTGDPDQEYRNEHLYVEVRIDNVEVDWNVNPYRIDHEIGLIVFKNAVSATSFVQIKYLWRAFVRVKEISLAQLAMAQHVYTGTVVFEEMSAPTRVERFDQFIVNEPCRDCENQDKRVTDTGEECPDTIGPSSGTQGNDTLVDWTNPERITTLDESYASCVMGSASLVSERLNGNQFNLATPSDLTKHLTSFTGAIYSNVANTTATLTSLRLTYNGVLIGPNLADGETIPLVYTFSVDSEDIQGYTFTWDELSNGSIGLSAQYTSVASSTVMIDYMELGVCYDDGDEIYPTPGDCKCLTTDPPEEVITNSYKHCLSRGDTITVSPYDIPTENYIHGVEITSYIEGTNNGCAEPPTEVAAIGIRLKLNTDTSTYSSIFSKSDQPIRPVDHAYLNVLDATSDLSWGGVNDCWGKPIGGWSPALVNLYGFKLESTWVTTCGPNSEGNWIYVKTYSGEANGYSDSEDCSDVTNSWGSSGEYTDSSFSCQPTPGGAIDIAVGQTQLGDIIHTFTWDGVGDPPTVLTASVYSKVYASIVGKATADSIGITGTNGLGDDFAIDSTGLVGVAEGTHTRTVNVIDGVATIYVQCTAAAILHIHEPVTTAKICRAYVMSSATTGDVSCQKPDLTQVDVVVHHSSVCSVGPNVYQESTATGWGTIYQGDAGGTAVTSSGASNGAFTLLGTRFELPTLHANSRIVGIRVTGEYRVSPSYIRVANMTVKVHLGTYDAGRAGIALAYPVTNDWTEFDLGGNGNFWDYSAVFAETSVAYPTATGTHVNTLCKLEIIGDNDTGYAYEFRNLKLTLFYFNVGDGF